MYEAILITDNNNLISLSLSQLIASLCIVQLNII